MERKTIQIMIFGLIWTALPGIAETNTELRAPMNGWLADAVMVATASAEEEVTGEGRVRRMAEIAMDKVRVFADSSDTKTVLLRIANNGSAGIRLNFDNLRLQPGWRLFVYGVDENNQVLASHGPYTAAGPLDTGEFWTPSLPGVAAIVELQFTGEMTSLPFDFERMALADTVDPSSRISPAAPAAEKRASIFRGMRVEHTVIDGQAIWQGDMILGRAEELEPAREGRKHDERNAGSLAGTSYKWPNGVMPYTIDPSLPNQARITAAIAHWNTRLNGYVKLVPRTDEPYYVHFKVAAATTCSSFIGMTRQAAQPINIGEYCATGAVIHEIGHAFGLYHEQSRSDRDNFVRILTENIEPANAFNFNRANSDNWTGYDYESIMHYGAYAFSRNGQPTIETIPAGIPIGQRSVLSTGDVNGIKEMYPAAAPPSGDVSITFSTNPAGRILTVDESHTATPRAVQWAAGSTHTISAPDQISGTTKYVFRQWSDGGEQMHTVTAPDADATYTATYNLFYKLTASASYGGTVAVTSQTDDDFYPANSVVVLTATADPDYCLTSWGGLMPISSYGVAVTLSRAVNITANFQVGVVTAPTAVTAPSAGITGYINTGAHL